MKQEKRYLYLTPNEFKIVIYSLTWLRNAKIQRGEYTDWVDELLIKAMKAPVKKVKIHN